MTDVFIDYNIVLAKFIAEFWEHSNISQETKQLRQSVQVVNK